MRNLGSLVIGVDLLVAACSSSKSPASGGGGNGGSGSGGATGGDAAVVLSVTHPNPLISRDGHAYSSPAGGGAVIDGNYHSGAWSAGTPTAANPSWVAIKMTPTPAPTRVLLSWDDGGTYDYDNFTPLTPPPQQVYGLPSEYHLDVSADSTNGLDGTWTTVVPTTENQVRTRAHSFDFTGKSWVKMVITGSFPEAADGGVTGPSGVAIGEIDVHDISATPTGIPDDTWFFMGDSITAFAYDRAQAHQPSFAATINTNTGGKYFPAMINGGIGSETSGNGLARLGADLALNPDYRFWVIAYGTNDAANDQVPTSLFQSDLQSMITMVQAAGRIPILSRIPYSSEPTRTDIPSYNTVIDRLIASNGLLMGPDLYAYFLANQADFVCPPCGNSSPARPTDGIHPNDVGLQEMNTLWATAPAIAALYR